MLYPWLKLWSTVKLDSASCQSKCFPEPEDLAVHEMLSVLYTSRNSRPVLHVKCILGAKKCILSPLDYFKINSSIDVGCAE